MKRLFILAFLFVLVACDKELDWVGVEAGNATLAGILKNASGVPMARTVVSLYAQNGASYVGQNTTDSQGRFQFTGLSQGAYVVQAQVSGKKISQSVAVSDDDAYVQVVLDARQAIPAATGPQSAPLTE